MVKSVPRLRYHWVSQSEPLWIALITQVLRTCTRLHVSVSRVTWASFQVLLSVIWFFALSRRDLPSSERKVYNWKKAINRKITNVDCLTLNSYASYRHQTKKTLEKKRWCLHLFRRYLIFLKSIRKILRKNREKIKIFRQ